MTTTQGSYSEGQQGLVQIREQLLEDLVSLFWAFIVKA